MARLVKTCPEDFLLSGPAVCPSKVPKPPRSLSPPRPRLSAWRTVAPRSPGSCSDWPAGCGLPVKPQEKRLARCPEAPPGGRALAAQAQRRQSMKCSQRRPLRAATPTRASPGRHHRAHARAGRSHTQAGGDSPEAMEPGFRTWLGAILRSERASQTPSRTGRPPWEK